MADYNLLEVAMETWGDDNSFAAMYPGELARRSGPLADAGHRRLVGRLHQQRGRIVEVRSYQTSPELTMVLMEALVAATPTDWQPADEPPTADGWLVRLFYADEGVVVSFLDLESEPQWRLPWSGLNSCQLGLLLDLASGTRRT